MGAYRRLEEVWINICINEELINMGAEKKLVDINKRKRRESRPASEPEAREKQLVNLAVDLAEQQLREGTASAAVLTHYLKIASKRETLEREILEKQSALIEAKSTSLNKDREAEELAKKAIEAMKNYNSGSK